MMLVYIRFNSKVQYEDYVKTTGEEILARLIEERRLNAHSCNLRPLLKLRTN